VPDAWIVRVTQRELARDRVTQQERLDVDSQDGVVTLQASVSNRLAKERALDIARVVRGVRAIIDRVVVAAVPRPDYEIEFAVAGVLGHDPATAGARIAARAHQAVVRLSGDVDSNATRRIAVNDVLAIPGVVDVVDNLVVRPGKLADARLAAQVGRIVCDDPWLDDDRIHVSAKGGVVRLSGSVGSAAERARTENDARTASPAHVDVSMLRIENWVDDGTLRSNPDVLHTDGDIDEALHDAFARDPRVQPFVPTVDVRNRFVVLTGVAPTPEAARAVDEDARNLPGVADVRDAVRTLPADYEQSDAAISEQVQRTVLRDPRLSAARITIYVMQGRVYLRGEVPTDSDRLRAISIATSAPGVRDVDDGLGVAPPQLGVTSPQPTR
jgi:osmotically-inducible protein OsmY